MIKVLIADDQELIRQSLQIVLDSKEGLEVTDVAADGLEVIQCVRKQKPDVVLMDIRMPKMDGVQCTKIIKENYPQIKIIILTTFDDDEYVYNALKFGASGYLLKGVSMEELENAIRTVYGGRYLWHTVRAGSATLCHRRRHQRPAGGDAEDKRVCGPAVCVDSVYSFRQTGSGALPLWQ